MSVIVKGMEMPENCGGCRILEDGLEHWDENQYGPYGKPLFKAVATKYGWEL